MDTYISPNLLYNDFFSTLLNESSIKRSKEYINFSNDLNLNLNIEENFEYYVISGLFKNFNNYNIELNYTNNFLILDFFNKKLKKNNTIDTFNNYGTFRRMFYLEDIDINNIKLDFHTNVFQLLIKKIL